MNWIFIIALIPIAICIVRWVGDNAEYRSGPSYWLASLLTFTLLGLAMYMAHVQKHQPIPLWFWFVVAGLLLVILVLRRALKWR
jgi:hypothetical protein